MCSTAFGQDSDNAKFIEVTGTSEITLVPDEIHYLIEIKEYWEEEFDGRQTGELSDQSTTDRNRAKFESCLAKDRDSGRRHPYTRSR